MKTLQTKLTLDLPQSLKIIFFGILCIFQSFCAQAQKKALDSVSDSVKNGLIKKTRVLEEQRKQKLFSQMNKVGRAVAIQHYEIMSIKEDAQGVIPDLKSFKPVANIQTEENEYSNYIKVGLGNYSASYAELFLNSNYDKKNYVGLYAKHLDLGTGSVDDDNSGSAYNEIRLNFRRQLAKSKLFSSIKYSKNSLFFYGYNGKKNVEKSSISQNFQNIEANLSLEGNANPNLSYKLALQYSQLWDRFQGKEQEIILNGKAIYQFAVDARFVGDLTIALPQYSNFDTQTTRYFVKFSPAHMSRIGNLFFRLGLGMVHASDSVGAASRLRIYPDLSASYDISEGELSAYLHLRGDLQRNTWRSFTDENPFLNNQIALKNTDKNLEFRAGVRGNYLQILGFDISGSYSQFTNMAFFTNSAQDASKFAVLYDPAAISVFGFQSSFSLKINEFDALLKTEYTNYGVKNLEQAWHRASLRNTLFVSYRYFDQLMFNLDLFHIGGLQAWDMSNNQVVSLKNIVDLNLKANYYVSKRFSFFTSLNNLFSSNYQRFLYYDSRGFNFITGVTASF